MLYCFFDRRIQWESSHGFYSVNQEQGQQTTLLKRVIIFDFFGLNNLKQLYIFQLVIEPLVT